MTGIFLGIAGTRLLFYGGVNRDCRFKLLGNLLIIQFVLFGRFCDCGRHLLLLVTIQAADLGKIQIISLLLIIKIIMMAS